MNWTNIEEFIVIEELIDMHGTRVKRFFISVPAAITAAVVGASVVGTASEVDKENSLIKT